MTHGVYISTIALRVRNKKTAKAGFVSNGVAYIK